MSFLCLQNNDKHTITQFQFSDWPSSAGTVPEGTLGLVTLIEDVQQNQEKQVGSGPITVHCRYVHVFIFTCIFIEGFSF